VANLTVGQGQQYSTIAAAVAASRDGDVLLVQAGTYTNDFATIGTKITIQGVGGMAKLVATVAPPNGKGILVTNTDVTIDHLEFAGAKVADMNGAGIRYQGGNLTITNSWFHDNQNGLLANPSATGTITIKNSEFDHNGAGDGRSHNIYVGDIAKLSIDNSYFHDANVGHEIKSRAAETVITNSRVDDFQSTASYSIDLPNGGKATIANTVIQQGANTGNPAIVAFGEEGNLHATNSLVMRGNTVLNDRPAGGTMLWNATTASASATDTKVFGLTSAQLVKGTAAISGTTFLGSGPALDTSHPWSTTAAPAPAPTPAPAPAPAPLPALSVADASVLEGASGTYNSLSFAVKLSAPAPTGGVSVSFATKDGTGLAGSDYTATSGTLSFAAGETAKTVTVKVTGDNVVEPDETLHLLLSNAQGATISRGDGLGTIRNDDVAPAPAPAPSVRVINGTANAETIVGTDGDDRITGYRGDDVMTGKGGADTFVFSQGDGRFDQITDFTPGTDHLLLQGVASSTVRAQALTYNGTPGLYVTYGTQGDHVFLQHVTALKAGDILFG
jgi:hypothetical protein